MHPGRRNPSLCLLVQFMDEPTSGLDARSAAAVIDAVRNVAANGRTVMVTIHQPSIEIFEAFDRLVLLGMGGEPIFCGNLGSQSSTLVQYFEVRSALF
jgi:ABC-type multidrug transport system ATPase subunit